MPPSESEKRYSFDRPGNYRIRVEGFLDKKWSARLGGLRITASKAGDQKSVTVLEGQVRDQAELTGVLNALYQCHLTLLSVEHLNSD
jgi:hypothetical protein